LTSEAIVKQSKHHDLDYFWMNPTLSKHKAENAWTYDNLQDVINYELAC